MVWPSNDTRGESTNDFVGALLTSTYFTGSLSEYGVSAGQALGVIHMPGPAPTTIDYLGFGDIVDGIANDGIHAVDAETVYALVLPAETEVTVGGSDYCLVAGGTHDMSAGGHPYAFIPACVAESSFAFALSHELVEAATDPDPINHPTWQSKEPGLEVADLCGEHSTRLSGEGADGGTSWDVSRVYSAHRAAQALGDPCVPVPAGTWFGGFASPFAIPIAADDSGVQKGSASLTAFASGEGAGPSVHFSLFASGFDISPSTVTLAVGASTTIHFVAPSGAYSGSQPLYLYSTRGAESGFSVVPLDVE